MAFIVECVRGNPDEPDCAHFDLTTWQWDKLLMIAQQYGWQPVGCVFDSHRGPPEPHWEQPTDYTWGEWKYCKRVASEDARNLAAALRRAIAAGGISGHVPTLLSESGFIDPGLVGSARALADFAEGGAFAFAVDD